MILYILLKSPDHCDPFEAFFTKLLRKVGAAGVLTMAYGSPRCMVEARVFGPPMSKALVGGVARRLFRHMLVKPHPSVATRRFRAMRMEAAVMAMAPADPASN